MRCQDILRIQHRTQIAVTLCVLGSCCPSNPANQRDLIAHWSLLWQLMGQQQDATTTTTPKQKRARKLCCCLAALYVQGVKCLANTWRGPYASNVICHSAESCNHAHAQHMHNVKQLYGPHSDLDVPLE